MPADRGVLERLLGQAAHAEAGEGLARRHEGFAFDEGPAVGERALAEQALDELLLAVPGHTGHARDLARMDLQAHTVERQGTGIAFGHESG